MSHARLIDSETEELNQSTFLQTLRSGRRDFTGVKFTSPIEWPDDSEFDGYFNFTSADFMHDVNIGDTRIWGTLEFGKAAFDGKLHVYRSRILHLNADKAAFDGACAFANNSWFSTLNLTRAMFATQLWIESDVANELSLQHVQTPKTFIDWNRVPFETSSMDAQLGEVHLLPKK